MTHDPSEPTTGTRRDFLRRRWPPLLLAIPGLVVAELVAVRLWDNLYPGPPSSPPSGPLPPPITEGQKQPAVDPVRCLGILEQINGGQPWEVERVVGNARPTMAPTDGRCHGWPGRTC